MRVFLLLTVVPAIAIADQPQGIDYLGAGYDLVFGNPDGSEASSSVTDPGFRAHLIKFNWDDDENTCSGLSNNWTCPREASIMPDTSCMQQSSSSAITSTKEFQDVLQEDCSISASLSGSYGGFSSEASFSGSKSMAAMQNKISKDEITTYQSKAICVEYTASLKQGFEKSLLEPLPEFVSALGSLPAVYKSCYVPGSVGGTCPQRMTSGFGDLPPVRNDSRRLMAADGIPVLASGGKFIIRSVSKPTMCVDDGGGKVANKTTFHLWACIADNVNQVFTYDAATSMIHSANKPGLCVDDGGVTASGGSVLFRLHGCELNNPNQRFVYDSASQMFRNPSKNNLCIDSGGDGALQNIHLWECSQTNSNQRFTIEPWFPRAPGAVSQVVSVEDNTVVNDCACDASVNKYFRFIQLFGTHYTTRVEMGGKIVHRLEIKNSDVETLTNNNVDVAHGASIKASYEGIVASGAVAVEGKSSRSSGAKAFNSVMAVTQKEININVGGSPSEDWREWAKSTTDTPMPIRYRLSSLVDLIQNVDSAKVAPFEAAVKDYIAAYGKTLSFDVATSAKVLSLELKYSLATPAMGWIQFRVMIGTKGSMNPAPVTMYTATGSFTVDVPLKYQVSFGAFDDKVPVTLQYASGRFYPPAATATMEALKATRHTAKKAHWVNMEAKLAMKGQAAMGMKSGFGLTTPDYVTLVNVQAFAIMSDGTERPLSDAFAGEQLRRNVDWSINPMTA